MNYPDKFNLTMQESLFLAKKKWDENVYCGMKMENRAITFPQTKTILQGVNVGSVLLDDIQAVLNMRDAWKYLLSTWDKHLNMDYICKLNEFIARNEAVEWGVLRTGTVGISGTDYLPPIPKENKVAEEFNSIVYSDLSATEKALELFCWITHSQLFWDGNKRTALLTANKMLIVYGAGLLTIADKNMEKFNSLLLSYYNNHDKEPLKDFLYVNAIHGINYK